MSSLPTVAILVLNLNGREHLRACLPGLEAQVYPNREIVVVDNGSTDDSIDYVRRSHPGVRVMALGHNRGFSAAYNAAVAAVATEWVVILNNDTRVEPAWLHELVAAAERHGASAAAARILDWDGRRIDFIGGQTSFNGHSWQTDHGHAVVDVPAERELLFACGGSMLVLRRAFLEAGGFDEDFFAYFEDVDFGWRLSLLGHRMAGMRRCFDWAAADRRQSSVCPQRRWRGCWHSTILGRGCQRSRKSDASSRSVAAARIVSCSRSSAIPSSCMRSTSDMSRSPAR
ncbi:MAG: glycosyltransferase family 2 protein [Acidobacteria bacterium]|nr:glycosyltransferase family 2 protein [Acidobacteriota bacterium]